MMLLFLPGGCMGIPCKTSLQLVASLVIHTPQQPRAASSCAPVSNQQRPAVEQTACHCSDTKDQSNKCTYARTVSSHRALLHLLNNRDLAGHMTGQTHSLVCNPSPSACIGNDRLLLAVRAIATRCCFLDRCFTEFSVVTIAAFRARALVLPTAV